MPTGGAQPRGRPRKFRGPSRVVTLTLPVETIERLGRIDDDRGKAIVKATDIATRAGDPNDGSVALVEVAPGLGMLTVPGCASLRDVPNLALVEITPARFLIVLAAGTQLSELEITVADRLEALATEDNEDRNILSALLGQLRALRRSQRSNTAEVIVVQMP